MTIFQKSVIKRHLDNLDKEQVKKSYQKFRENYSPAKIEEIKKLKEEEYQDGFLRDIFVNVFGYILKPDSNYNLAREFKNQGDGKKADGAILKNEKAVAVIELKSTKTKDLKSITEQAFNYKNNQPECKYVITSNFQKLRFYIDYAHEYEEFDLFNLQKEDFELLYLLLSTNSIFSNLPIKLKEETKFHEQQVSDKLYKDYSVFKNKLFENLIKNNPDNDKLILFNKSQKLLDRFLFILFAEDSGLLPPNSISRIIDTYHKLEELYQEKPIYDIYKQYFGFLNTGRKGKTATDDIPAYNGGLFYNDELLDNLKIDDKILIDDLLKLSEYDFNTEVDVNILGHIFEHSLSEIEEITAEIEGTTTDKTKSKRKKDGVFYTPKYITQYIVENTIGTLCNEKRKELEIEEIEFDGSYRAKDGKLLTKGKKLYQKLYDYKDWLLSLKIVDPACGSGAFLNQALNFLIEEHKNIDDIIAELTNTALRLFDTDKAILENNLYGVDINEESVEIAKLSLWLRTAQKGRKLSSLNDNIKCGNSLIDNSEIAGEKAFDWNVEFKEIMQNGGFDVVIGNPPYVLCQPSNTEEKTLAYYKSFKVASYKIDLFHLFFEKSINFLKSNGKLGFITPNTYLTNKYIKSLRHFLLTHTSINKVVNHKEPVFPEASVDVATIIMGKSSVIKENIEIFETDDDGYFKFLEVKDQQNWLDDKDNIFNLKEEFKIELINCKPLVDICNSYFGIQAYDRKSSISLTKENNNFLPIIDGGDIFAYQYSNPTKYFNFIDKNIKSGGNYDVYKHERIVIRQIGKVPVVGLCKGNILGSNTLYNINLVNSNFDLLYILAILNSKLIKKYWLSIYSDSKQLFPKIKGYQLKTLPIKEISIEDQQPIINMINKIISFKKELHAKKNRFLNRINDNFEIYKISNKLDAFFDYDFKTFVTELKKQKIELSLTQQDEWEEYFNTYKNEINQLQEEINSTDKEINKMVYELYGLSEEEIEIVEGLTK